MRRSRLRDGLAVTFLAATLTAATPVTGHAAGFPNVPRTEGELIVGPCAPQAGRLTIMAYHNGIFYSSPETVESFPQVINGVTVQPDFAGRAWDLGQIIASPTNPQPLQVFAGMNNGFNAHGCMFWNDANGSHAIFNPRSFRATTTFGSNSEVAYNTYMPAGFGPFARGNMMAPWNASTYWSSYGAATGLTTLRKDNVLRSEWDHLGTVGLKDMPMLCGNLLIYGATGSQAGVAIYDLSLYMDADAGNDPAAPPLLGVISDGGFGGYWPELYGWGGRLYVVNGVNSIRVVDITDPAAPFLAVNKDVPGMSHAVYPTFQDQYAFLGGKKIDMTNFNVVLTVGGSSVVHTVPGIGDGKGAEVSQMNLPVGNLLITGGLGSDQGMMVFAHQAAPDTRGPEVGFHIPRAGQANYPVGAPITFLIPETLEMTSVVSGTSFIVRPLGGSAIPGRISRTSGNALLTFFPDQILSANTTYEVVLPAGGIKDAAGNGISSQYTFTFSTGSTVGGNLPPVISSVTATPHATTPNTSVQVSISATDSGTIQYRYDFGDGSGFTAWGTATSASRTYTTEGHYNVTVQARDSQGAVSSRQLVVTVVNTNPSARPTHSNQIAKDLNGKIWVVNPDNDSVSRLNPVTRVREATYALDADAGSEDPRSVAVAANGKVWVTCFDDDAIRILNPATGAVENTLTLRYGAAPFAVCMSPDGTAAYVTLYGSGGLLRYDTANPLTAPKSLALGPTARAISVTSDGSRILVTRFISQFNHGDVWDVAWNSVTATLGLTRTIRLAYRGNLQGPSDGTGGASYLSSIAISPSGAHAYVTTKKDNITGGLLFGDGVDDIDADETVRAELRGIDLTTNAENANLRVDLDNSDSASAITFSNLGDYVFVPQQGNNLVTILDRLKIDPTANLGSMVGRVGTGLAPQAVFVDVANNVLLAHNFMDRTVTFLGLSGLEQTGSANLPTLGTVSTLASGTEKLSAQVLLGKKLFYNASALDANGNLGMSAEGYISCATCHIDGTHDGRTWDFSSRGEGLRNTADLRGRRGMAHGNVHWTANFNEIQDFVHDIIGGFGGTGFLATGTPPNPPLGASNAGIATDITGGDPLDALAAYVASLNSATVPRSVYRNTDGTKTTDAVAGAAIFTQQGCATCHIPANGYTDSSLSNPPTLSDVGTTRWTSGSRMHDLLAGIDTPTLAGVWETGPYFHNGSAQSLREVFEVTGGEMYALEDGTVGGTSTKTLQYMFINNANSPHGGFVTLRVQNDTINVTGADGGAGGSGVIELRYMNTNTTARAATLIVNGASYPLSFPITPGNSYWGTVRIPNVTLTAGRSNSVTARLDAAGTSNISLDEMTISRPAELTRAQPHRRVLSLATADQDRLIAYLLQLDGSDLSDSSTPAARSGPTAVTDTLAVNEGVSTDLSVLANDTGTGLALTRVDQAVHGLAEIVGNQVRYTPSRWMWGGTDTFTYAVRDANGRAHWTEANITVTQSSGTTPLPSHLLATLDQIGTGVSGQTRTRTDGQLELAVTGGAGIDGGGSGVDSLFFANKAIGGNFRATVQIRSVDSDSDGRAGLMLRDLAGGGARFVALTSTTGSDYRVRSRLAQSATAQTESVASVGGVPVTHAFPNKWAMLERVGDSVFVYVGSNGVDYQLVQQVTLPGLGHWTSVGLYANSGSSTGNTDALFAGYRVDPLAPAQPNAGADLLARYDFENTTTIGQDSAGTHHATAISGAISSTDAAVGSCSLEVTGGQYIEVPFAADLNRATFTVAGWIKLQAEPGASQNCYLLSTRFGGENTFDLAVRDTHVRSQAGTGAAWIDTTLDIVSTDEGNLERGGDLPAGQWFHLAYVVDDARKEFRLYLNGDLKRTQLYTGTAQFMKSGQTLRLGRNSASLKTWLDDLRVYSRALGGSDVASLAGVPFYRSPGLKREWWTSVAGSSVSNLTTYANYVNNLPSGTDVLLDEARAVGWMGLARAGQNNSLTDNYGQRIRGYIQAPATGTYTFFIGSDDASEIWLSPDSSAANKVRVAWVSTWNTWNATTNQPGWLSNTNNSAKSSNNTFSFAGGAPGVITLQAGQYYYVEILHKEGGSQDFLAAGWTKPGETVGSAPSEIIPGRVLFHDGMLSPNQFEPGAARNYWSGITGTTVASLTAAAAYINNTPTGSDLLTAGLRAAGWTGSSAPGAKSNWGDNYGQRIRGFITPPTSGNYVLWIGSDDASELWLSPGTDPAAKVLVASVTSWNSFNTTTQQPNWLSNGTTTARSNNNTFSFGGGAAGVVTLHAGQFYYFEVLQKEGGGGDHLSVGWTKPGETVGTAPTEIVPASAVFHNPALVP